MGRHGRFLEPNASTGVGPEVFRRVQAEQVGLVHGAQFLPAYADPATNATMRSVAVLTEQAVVAVLNQRTGAIVWRKQLDGAHPSPRR